MIRLYFQAIRINNVLIAIACCFTAFLKISGNNHIDFFLGLIIIILLMIASNFINDIYDIKVDKINNPNRLLVVRPELKRNLKILVFISFFISCFISFLISNITFLIVFFSVPVLFLYTPLLKGIPLVGNIMVSAYLALVFIFIELCISNNVETMILPACFAFGISLIREIIKDVEDYEGDKIVKIYTLPVCLGIKKTIYFVCFLMLCFLSFCFSIILLKNNFYYNISVFFLVFMPIFYLIFFLIKSPTSKSCFEASALLKKITVLGLIIIYII